MAHAMFREKTMSWIEEIESRDGDPGLQRALKNVKDTRGKVSNIMKAQSLFPSAMDAHLKLYQCLMHDEGELSRAEREMIALVVSATNNCTYSVSHVADALSHYETDNCKLREIIAGREFQGLEHRHAHMLRYAIKLTTKPDKIDQQDIEKLREIGFSDRQILEINMLAAYFNFSNRIACGLGVSFDEKEITGYKV